MWAWRDVTMVQDKHTHIRTHTAQCAFISMQETVHNVHIPTPLQKCRQSGGDQLFFCGGRSQLRHLKRTEHGAWRRLPPLVLYLKEIYLFDAILPSFGIHQVEYLSRDQKGREGDRTENGVMTYWRNAKMERFRENRTKKKKLPNRKHRCCVLQVFHSVERVYPFVSCLCECVYQAEHHIFLWFVCTCMLVNVNYVSTYFPLWKTSQLLTIAQSFHSPYLNLLQGNRCVAQQVPGLVHLTELTAANLLLNLEVCQWVMAHIWLQWFLKRSETQQG